MGMFDWVKFEKDCPVCGNKVTGFQSKDGECTLSELEFWQVDRFYSHCEVCDTWIEFSLKEETRKKLTIDDYKMEIKTVKDRRKMAKDALEKLTKIMKVEKEVKTNSDL